MRQLMVVPSTQAVLGGVSFASTVFGSTLFGSTLLVLADAPCVGTSTGTRPGSSTALPQALVESAAMAIESAGRWIRVDVLHRSKIARIKVSLWAEAGNVRLAQAE